MKDPDQTIKDTMLFCFQKYGQKSNIPQLEEDVNNLCKMITQSDAGQRGKKGNIDWIELKPTLWSIVIGAAALVLSGDLDQLKEDPGRKTAEWFTCDRDAVPYGFGYEYYLKCSNCGYETDFKEPKYLAEYHYCPKCGRLMTFDQEIGPVIKKYLEEEKDDQTD